MLIIFRTSNRVGLAKDRRDKGRVALHYCDRFVYSFTIGPAELNAARLKRNTIDCVPLLLLRWCCCNVSCKNAHSARRTRKSPSVLCHLIVSILIQNEYLPHPSNFYGTSAAFC